MPKNKQQQAAYDAIARLVEHFSSQIEALKKEKEAQIRISYIDPLFEALGWDIDNTKLRLPNAYKDVIYEDKLDIGGQIKAPDYCFTNYGKKLFYVEAKKVAVLIKTNIEPSYQLRRYAWSAKLPISILTDFEEFALYDGTKQPQKTDSAIIGRLKYLTYTQYLGEFDWLWDLFSKEQVLKGSLEQFAKADKKGTQSVDYAFLQSLDKWRNLLASNIALRNKHLSEDEMNYLVQMNINRIVFLRNCEDRGAEPYGTLKNAVSSSKGEGTFFKNVFQIFGEADRKYNSGLFDFDKDTLSRSLVIDNKVLDILINELYYPESPYEFSVIGAEILGTAYERFLGKVIRLSSTHQAKVEEKPEVRKAGGVFYTPQYIVEYIVKNTVGKFIEGKTPEEIAKIKICDPACGSGSFLLGAYQCLLDYHAQWYAQHYKKSRSTKGSPLTPDGKLSTAIKKEILLNNIYGVDIDTQAVEVSKLSLLLKCMEGETQASMQTTLTFERILPTLDNNIKSGNSLIDFDFYDAQSDFEDNKKIKPFNWKQAFPKVFKPRERLIYQPEQQLKRHYEWVRLQTIEAEARSKTLKKNFGVEEPAASYNTHSEGGFDIIIGNPPYVYLPDKSQQNYFASKYLYQDYQQDLYLLFLERYHALLAPNGYVGVIISNTWLQSVLLKKIRKHLIQSYRWDKFLHLSERVFQDAVVDTHVLIFEKENPLPSDVVQIEVYKKGAIIGKHELVQANLPQNGEPINIIAQPKERLLFEKIKNLSIDLKELCEVYVGVKPFQVGKGKPKQTAEIVHDKPFVKENQAQPSSKWSPLLRGSLINRYKNLWNNNHWILYGEWLAEPRFSALFDAPEKIMVRQTGDSIIGTIVGAGVIARNNLHVVLTKNNTTNYRYILGILNSKLMDFCYQQINPEKGEALAEVKKKHVEMLPLPKKVASSASDEIVNNVNLLLQINAQLLITDDAAQKAQMQGRCAYAEQRINEIVYEIYGLSREEVLMVENR